MRFTVRAPASSANLGPGFDAIGLALDLWNELGVETARRRDRKTASGEEHEDGIVVAPVRGRDAHLLEGRENLALKAMRTLAEAHGRELPPCTLTPCNGVPVARGLGSSAAALVAGLVAANRLLDLNRSTTDLYRHAWEMEGHGDNVGAACYGGAVLAVPGVRDAVCLCPGDAFPLVAVVFIPEATGATWAARAALPQDVPYADAVHNLAAASGLVAGLLTRDPELIGASMRDRLHEPYRARLFPHLEPMVEAALHAGASGACLSGAGPTILALTPPGVTAAVARALADVARQLAVTGEVTTLATVSRGAYIVEDPDQSEPTTTAESLIVGRTKG
ncbi:MAG TPA: homoserine kinase [Thermomicrobiales bacterium]|nr:homoserine kinase [Thermomicrobiales bacterium]